MRLSTLFGVLVGSALLAAACGGGSNQTEMERQLQNFVADELTPIEISGVDCPEDASMEPESVFLCGAEVESSYYEIEVTILDAQGRFDYEPRHAVLNVVNTEIQLQDEVSTALGFSVVVDCGDNEYLVVSVDNTFQCTLTREDGAQRNIEVQVENARSLITWSLLPN